MSRVEKFKQRRNLRQKYLSAAVLFFFLMTAGLLSVDYSTNYLMSGRQGIALAALNNKTTSLEITFMNQKLYVNTQYINRDLNRFRVELQKLFRM